MLEQPTIAVLLPTYNGELYLTEQLQSLLSQDYDKLVIVVRDDGSTDSSPSLLADFAAKHEDCVHLIEADGNNLGASGSFTYLVNYVLSKKQELGLERVYMAFCDQDDVWLPDKLSRAWEHMRLAEAGDYAKPVLVHSDLEVVDEHSQRIAPSLIEFQGLEIHRNQFANLVISNLVTGCTALINEGLAEKAMPVSDRAIMHDWWLALVASAFGELVFVDEPWVRYRQHGNNTIGAKEFITPKPSESAFWQRVFSRKPNEHLIEVAIQAGAFLQRYAKELSFRERLALRITSLMNVRIGAIQRIFYRLARRF